LSQGAESVEGPPLALDSMIAQKKTMSIKETLIEVTKKAAGDDARVELTVPEEPSFGHYSTNLAMRMGSGEKGEGKKHASPLELAKELADKIAHKAPLGFFSKVEAVPPGFINFWLSKETLWEEFGKTAHDARYGMHKTMEGKTVMVEYTDPNPFKLFHIGHLMSNAIGESISRLIESQGAKVERISYGGDVGLHVAKAIHEVLARKDEIEKIKKGDEKAQLAFWADAYVVGSAKYEADESAKAEIDALNKTIFEKSDKEINKLYDWGRNVSIKHFKEMFARLDSKFKKNYWESEVADAGVKAVEDGLEKGIFEKSEGAVIFRGEPYGLHTRVFVNSKGVPTYEAKELGLAVKKQKDFHFDRSIVVTGNEQNDYFKVMFKAMELLKPEVTGRMIHIGHGMLRLSSGKMSSRKGNVIAAETLIDQAKEKIDADQKKKESLIPLKEGWDEILEVVAIGALRYSILRQNPGQDIVFDFEKSLSFEGDSGPYLQYAYARLRSILRKREEQSASGKPQENYEFLNTDIELQLMRKILEFPDIIQRAAENYAPSGLANYLRKLATIANKFYETTPILKDDDENRKAARLTLVETTARVLKEGLHLLGIKTLEKI